MTEPRPLPDSGASSPAPSMAQRLARAPWWLIGFIPLTIILMTVDLSRVADQFSRIGLPSVAGATAAFAFLLIGRCWRWRVLTRAVGVEEPLIANIASCNRAIWLGLVTPGRLGEFRRTIDLAIRRNWSLAASGWLVFFDLCIDFAVYLVFAIGGLAYFFVAPALGLALWAGLLAIAVTALLISEHAIGFISRTLPFLFRTPGAREILPALESGLRGKKSLAVILSTALSAAAFVAMMACLVNPMDVGLGPAALVATLGIATATAAIPISYLGLGTREAALIWFLGQRGLDQSTAVAVSFTYLLASLIGITVSLAADITLRRTASKGRE